MTNKKSKFLIAISATAVAGALTFGAVASAAGTDNSGYPGNTPGGRQHLTTQQKCDHAAQVETKVTTMKQRVEQRIATLNDRKAKAVAAGHADRAQRIQHRIDLLTAAEQRIDAKYAKFESFVQANCGTGATTTTGA